MVIDIIFAIVAAYGFYLGYSKGIIKTIFTVLSVTFGLMAAFKFGPSLTQFLENTFNNDNPLMFIAGFLLSFVVMMVIIRMFARGLEGLLESANINIINQIAGGFLLSGILILVFSVMLWFGDSSHLVDDSTKEQSITYPYLKAYPQQVWRMGKSMQPMFQEFWDHSIDFMDKLQDMSVERSESNPDIFDIEDEENN